MPEDDEKLKGFRSEKALGQLRELRTLTLDRNLLSGTVPAALGAARHLKFIDLSVNRLEGGIPPELGL